MSAAAFLVLALSLAAAPEASPDALPETIFLKTTERTFSRRYEYALRGGRIYWKLRQPEYGQPEPHWALLGPAGLPFQEGGPREDDPKRIAAIAADATGLVAVADDNRIFDIQIEDLTRGKFTWYYGWGYPWRFLPDKAWLPRELRAWTYSLLNIGANYSEDMDGNPHTIIAVDSVFVLPPDGRELWFDDPWLPPNQFDFRIAGPERGAFAAVNISASGSLVLVIDRRGRMYTRLVDFDSIGGNPGINYSWERRHLGHRATGPGALARALLPMFLDVRSLPPEPWHRQPDITGGKITRLITVLQTGEGNAARELRVQGTDATGVAGFWHKPPFADAWKFRATGEPIEEPFLDPQAPPEVSDSTDERCEGTAELARPENETAAMRVSRLGPRPAGPERVPAVLSGFNVGWDPARIEIPAGSGQFVTLHLRPWSTPVKPGVPIRLLGTLEFPWTDVAASPEEAAALARLRAQLGGRRLRQVFVYLSDAEVRIEDDPFGAIGSPGFVMRFARKHGR
ncbi:MAG TPA: hypothetical protein VIG99_20780 [Myxococcaceae bacterium]|jgi:hypothetical protein